MSNSFPRNSNHHVPEKLISTIKNDDNFVGHGALMRRKDSKGGLLDTKTSHFMGAAKDMLLGGTGGGGVGSNISPTLLYSP
jgi:hypothetical protein